MPYLEECVFTGGLEILRESTELFEEQDKISSRAVICFITGDTGKQL